MKYAKPRKTYETTPKRAATPIPGLAAYLARFSTPEAKKNAMAPILVTLADRLYAISQPKVRVRA